ncbi:MAG: uracil-DNA glycosylase [Pseudomonadota bacterium]
MTPPEAPHDCRLCPRLAAFRDANAAEHPDWFNGPAPSFGPDDARLLIVGLAPGLRGANRTGRPFTGDWAGDLLYGSLGRHGLSRGTYAARPDDGLELVGAMITNAVRCVPPENKPIGAEITTCRPYLIARIAGLPRLRAILTLGKISHDSTVRALGLKLKDHAFGHAARYEVAAEGRPLTLLSSYHCSRYNTNTGRLTEAMFDQVMGDAKAAAGL